MRFPSHIRSFLAFAAVLLGTGSNSLHAAPPPVDQENWYLVIGHGGQRAISRDGKTWENFVSWSEPKHNQDDLNVAVNFKGAFFAAGGYFSGRLTATRDGKTWSDGVIPGSSPIFGLEILGDTLYAVDLRGKVFKTKDGEKWEAVAKAAMPDDKHWIRGCAQGNGLIVGSGDYGPVIAFDPKTKSITLTQMAGQVDKNPGPKRVAFGNGVFVVVGQAGLIATTKDGKTFENNKTDPGRGDLQCVEFNGKEFLATTIIDPKTKKLQVLRSTDGLSWSPGNPATPRQVRNIVGWLYASSYPGGKISRSKDGGATWEPLTIEKGRHFKAYAYGPLSGGPPPKVPAAPPKKKVAPKPKANAK